MRWIPRTIVVIAIVSATSLLNISTASATNLPNSSPVIDQAEIFTSQQISELETQIKADNAEYDLRYVIETIPSLPGEGSLDSYVMKRANELGVQSENGNGVYILIDEADRLVRFDLGNKITPIVSPSDISQVMDNIVVPQLQNDKYFEGVILGMEAVGDLYTMTSLRPHDDNSEQNAIFTFDIAWPVAVIAVGGLLIGIILFTSRQRTKNENQRKETALQLERKQKGQEILQEILDRKKLRNRFENADDAESRKEIAISLWQNYLNTDNEYTVTWYKDFIDLYLSHHRQILKRKLPDTLHASLKSLKEDPHQSLKAIFRKEHKEVYRAQMKAKQQGVSNWFRKLHARLLSKEQ